MQEAAGKCEALQVSKGDNEDDVNGICRVRKAAQLSCAKAALCGILRLAQAAPGLKQEAKGCVRAPCSRAVVPTDVSWNLWSWRAPPDFWGAPKLLTAGQGLSCASWESLGLAFAILPGGLAGGGFAAVAEPFENWQCFGCQRSEALCAAQERVCTGD